MYIMVNLKKDLVNKQNANFGQPAVIVANHHSFLDILLLLMLDPRIVMVTNDWVYYSPFFGQAVRYADFIHAAKGLEAQLEKINELVSDGYSIAVFPEGTRSKTAKTTRFHKGAFYLAEQLNLDIQPIAIHGTSYIMQKGDDFYLKSGKITMKFLPRIPFDSEEFGANYSDKTKQISLYFKKEYNMLRAELETPAYFKESLTKNYLYKGPVLEWYLRIKFKLEDQYAIFDRLIPKEGRVVDLGCGYGFVSYALAFSGEKRDIIAIDYDEEKIEVAKNCPAKPDTLSFAHGDVVDYDFGIANTFIISDVLHYLLKEEQISLLDKMAANLAQGGQIIVRDGDSNKNDRHKGTILTEIFSTKSGFNKTRNRLNFISMEMIKSFASKSKLLLEVIDNTKHTSNILFVLKKPKRYGGI